MAAHEPRVCDAALARAFDFLGKRWNGVLLGTLQNGPAGFAELRRAVAGISDSVLSDRLGELTEAGLVVRSVEQGPPVSVSYALTRSGAALLPALTALTEWSAQNLTAERCAGKGTGHRSARPASVVGTTTGAATLAPPGGPTVTGGVTATS